MATVVRLKDLTKEQVAAIIQLLTLIPVDAAAEEQKKWGRKKFYSAPKSPPIVMYQMTEDYQHVIIPYRFACTLLGKMVNQDEPHVRVINDYKPAFAATLRDYQISPANETYQQLFTYGSTTLGLPPGWGRQLLVHGCGI